MRLDALRPDPPNEPLEDALRRFEARDFDAAAVALAHAAETAAAADDRALMARVQIARAIAELERGDADRARMFLARGEAVLGDAPAPLRALAAEVRARLPAARLDPVATLRTLVRIFRRADEEDLPALLASILDVALEAAGASRGLLVILRPDGPEVEAARRRGGGDLGAGERAFSRHVVRRTIDGGAAFVAEDARKDPRLQQVESIRGIGAGGVVCAPLESRGRRLGALYLDAPEAIAFTAEQVDLVVAMAEQAALAIERLLESSVQRGRIRDLETELRRLRPAVPPEGMIGASPPMQALYRQVEQVAAVDYPVILEGETGTGKELVARAIHAKGRRRERPFVAVNVGALSETLLESELFGHAKGAFTGADADRDGLFAQADGGVLLLDEIEEMPAAMQTKLLRAIEEGKVRPVGGAVEKSVDVRIVAASNRALAPLVESGRFRQDLYYRLKTFVLRVPPLRERSEDIPALVEHFRRAVAAELGTEPKPMAPAVLPRLAAYPWPGNVRELRNEIRRLHVVSGATIEERHLPEHIREPALGSALLPGGTHRDAIEAFEREFLRRALEANGGQIKPTARALGMNLGTLRARLRKYGLSGVKD